MRHLILTSLVLAIPLCSNAAGGAVDFARDIRPILSDKCFFCHGPDEEDRKAELRLDLRESAFSERDGVTPIHPGDLEKSDSWQRIITDDEDDLMPPPKANKSLTEKEKSLIRQWIEEGAEWTEHWSFIPPQKVAPSNASDGLDSRAEIDQFINAQLGDAGLTAAPEADRRILIRRLSFDLNGLPPTQEEVNRFVKDQSADAYESLVDRLLASDAYGQRMALMWLDAARYGDTSVMHADGPRDMWAWRDWVVDAYNSNQPYDQFSIEQIAGDLIPNPTNAQLIASGFNRNHPSSDEGGAIAEELRVSYVVDRVMTTANVWLGLSMECAQCHDHKYDPVSQKEYYQFYAYFNNTEDPGMQTRRGNQSPVVEVVTHVEEDKLRVLDSKLTDISKSLKPARAEALGNSIEAGTNEPDKHRDVRFKNLKHFYPLNENRGRFISDAIGSADLVGATAILCSEREPGNPILKLTGSRVFDAVDFSEFDVKSQLTLSTWIRIESPEISRGAVFAKMDEASNHRGFDLWIQKGKPAIHLINSWPKNALKVVSEQALIPGKWQHVAITYNGGGTPDSVKIYIDGKAVAQTAEAKKLTGTMKNDVPFRIGGRSNESVFEGEIDDIHIYDRALKPAEISWAQQDLLKEALTTVPEKRSKAQKAIVTANSLIQSTKFTDLRAEEIRTHISREALLRGKTTSMVMADNPPNKTRMTYVLDRGAYDSPREDEVIQSGTPAALPPLPKDAPANRLGLARWLFDDSHPLTARVAVNQIWQLFFGNGIVRTPADFGAQGAFPSHRELLDWLAVDFQESGWDVKNLVKQIVMSQTYRQSSNLGPEDSERDSENIYLARAPRFRLQAEMIRDNALSLSGLLDLQSGGPGVKPYQPPGLWAEVGLGGKPLFVQDHGDKLYRRTLYTYWKRSSPPPAMIIFDAPNRETCVIQRPRTNTPLQALAAMNDLQMMEASRHFAERLMKEGGNTPEEQATWAFQEATARIPQSGELDTLLDVYRHGLSTYESNSESSKALLSAGESDRDTDLDAGEHAAWTVVTSLILNLDEVLTRN